MNIISNDISQDLFVYQPTLATLGFKKKIKGTDYALSWKSREIYNFELKLLYSTFLRSMTLSGYRIGIKIDKYPLSVEQNNYLSKIVNVYTFYNFKFKSCLFWAKNLVTNSDKEKYEYSGYGAKFDSAISWSFHNDAARNVIIFGSSSHSDNSKDNFFSATWLSNFWN